MSSFQEKISAALPKKEALFDESLGRYAVRSMYAGAYLTMSTAVGIIGADVIASQFPSLSRFVFTFIFAIGLVFVLIFGGATIHFHNPQFLIIKDSIFDALLGTVFILCPLIKRNILKELFDNLLALKESGWQMISYAWGIFFMVSAGLNEFVRQHFHVSIWVEYKAINTVAVIVFGGILFLFAEKFRDSQFSNRFGIRIKR